MRRAALGLVERGLCQRAARGIVLPENFLERAEIRTVKDRLHDCFETLLDDFVRTGFSLPKGVRQASRDARLIAALDIYLSVFELTESRISDPMSLYILGAVTVANAAPVAADPFLAERYGYADTVPPDDLRAPISLQAISGLNGFPYSTIWRQARALETAGLLRRQGAGYLLADIFMDSAVTSARSVEKIKYVRRVLRELAADRG